MDQNALAAFTGQPPAQQQQAPAPRKVADNVYMTDFNDEVSKYEFELYTGKVNEVHHLQVLRPDQIARGRSHFHEKLKSGVLCNSVYTLGADGRELLTEERNCCKWLGSSSPRFAVLVVQYGTLPNGQIITNPFKYYLKVWRFGVDKFNTLKQINRDFPLASHDITISCSDEKFQKLTINPKSNAIINHPQFPGDHKKIILDWANSSISKLPEQMGRKFPDDQQLYAALQQAGVVVAGAPGGPAMPQMVPQDQPVANFGDIIGTVVKSQ